MNVERTSFHDEHLKTWWREMYASGRLAGATFFQRWEWNIAWWEVFGEGNPRRELCLLMGTDEGNIRFVAPLFVQKRLVGPRVAWEHIHWIGEGLTPYFELISSPPYTGKAWEALFTFCRTMYPNAWYQFNEVRAGDSLESVVIPGDWRVETIPGSVFHAVRFSSSAHCRALDAPHVHPSLRRALRRWEEHRASHHLEIRAFQGTTDEAISTLMYLNRLRFGERSFFSEQRNSDFLLYLSRLCGEDFVHSEVRFGDHVIHTILLFRAGSTFFYFLSGMDPSASFLTPGFGNLSYLWDRLPQSGSTAGGQCMETVFDLLRGEERYKRDFGAEETRSRHWHIVPPSASLRYRSAQSYRAFRNMVRQLAPCNLFRRDGGEGGK